MKKVLILQNKGKTYGGVWQVNKLIGEALLEKGYQVHIVSIRNNHNNLVLDHHKDLVVKTINEKGIWGTYTGTEIIYELKQKNIIKAARMFLSRLKHELSLLLDIKKLHQYIKNYNPDHIITAHYQLLDMIPKKYLNITIHEQHSSFKECINHKKTKETFVKYNGKITYLWLTEKTMQDAKNFGLKNCQYIYNAVRFKSDEIADVANNKKLITIARLSHEKRIDMMIDIAKEIFKDKLFSDWTLEIYGTGETEELLIKKVKNHKQIKLMGLTNNPQKELLKSSINLNTSLTEGFSLSILEANECGIPTITFNFGESTEEEIMNGKTGIIAKDKQDYINKLKQIMIDKKQLIELSRNAKEFSKNFHIENIINKWIELFNEYDK